MNIRETRELKIKERVITLENVLCLAKILENERQRVSDEAATELTFTASCTDSSSFSSQEPALFEKDSPLSKKRVGHIQMEFRHYKTMSRITIGLAHGNGSWRNDVTISGTDSTWVNGTLKAIEETIDSFTPQNTFLYQNEKTLRIVFSLGLGSLYFWMASLIPTAPSAEMPGWAIKLNLVLSAIPLGYYLFKYAMAFLVGWLPSEILYNKLKDWWPSVELQIGPEHTLTEKQRRKWIASAFIFGVFPLATAVIYDLIKVFSMSNG